MADIFVNKFTEKYVSNTGTPALKSDVAVSMKQYKQVLLYLNLDPADQKYYEEVLKNRIKAIYYGVISYQSILNYYVKYAANLKSPELFSDDWCFLVAILLVEKNLYQNKYVASPLARIAGFVNAYLYEKAITARHDFTYLDGHDSHENFAKRDYNTMPDFNYKQLYTAEAKKHSTYYNENTVIKIAKQLVADYLNMQAADYGIIIFLDKTVVVFNTKTFEIKAVYKQLDFKQIIMQTDAACIIK